MGRIQNASAKGRNWLFSFIKERELLVVSGDRTDSIRLSTRTQLLSLMVAAILLSGFIILLFSLFAGLHADPQGRAAINSNSKSTAELSAQLDQYKKATEALSQELKQRQDLLDDLYRAHFGNEAAAAGERAENGSDNVTLPPVASNDSTALHQIQMRQIDFAVSLTEAIQKRSSRAADAIRSFGLNPATLAKNTARGQGGPFVPIRNSQAIITPELDNLMEALVRMETLERSLISIPSGQPTITPMLSSSYGFRRDPFNGRAAFHAGMDFPGRTGQSIFAAANGKVIYVGQRQGYGNVIEVEHGNGLMTRYAHLSGFNARAGQNVNRGAQIGRMGSTGRSTGPHLHFEVRLNGDAINPRRFLEVHHDVLKTQQTAKARFVELGRHG